MERVHAEEPEQEVETARVPASARSPEVARALVLQRQIGNRATAQTLSRAPREAAVGAEKVMVETDAEETEAKNLIDGIKSKYGVEISSAEGVKSTLALYKDAPQAERDKVKARPWLLSELKSLEKALAHFQPIMGTSRASSTRKDVAQEVVKAGKATFSISANSATGTTDNTLGQYYRDDKTFAMYTKNETSTVDFPGNKEKQQEATAVHEIAHGLMDYALDGFMAATGYWTNKTTKSGAADKEAPPTPYGNKNAGEDLAESVMFYFVDKARLKDGMSGKTKGQPGNPCPVRLEYLKGVIEGWTPKVVIRGDALEQNITDESLAMA